MSRRRIVWIVVAVLALCSGALPIAAASASQSSSGLGMSAVLASSEAAAAKAGGESESEAAAEEGGHEALNVAVWSVLPFVALLLCIAVVPLMREHWWEPNWHKALIALPLGLVALGYLFGTFGGEATTPVLETMFEYVAFIALLGSLYVISGGILIAGDFRGTPLTNTAFLAVGGVLASFIGTTGAAMLLIRPLLRANRKRQGSVKHVVIFFIFIVANCGGLLTPLGDPPLFLGFLKGVPFEWTLRLIPEWGLVVGSLLGMFFVLDLVLYRARGGLVAEPVDPDAIGEALQPLEDERRARAAAPEKFAVKGAFNFVLLLGVVGVVLGSGLVHPTLKAALGSGLALEAVVKLGQALLMVLLAAVSMMLTPKPIRERNEFSFHPINEVAVLFVGIFLAMIPALQYLNRHGGELVMQIKDAVGLSAADKAPWIYFWATGALSSFLDNAPTYLTFLSTAQGATGESARMLALGPDAILLKGIACGAVFMGANSYIGNGPNFMVKAIAESSGVRMPSFFGYMAWAFVVLVPLLVIVSFVFFATLPAVP